MGAIARMFSSPKMPAPPPPAPMPILPPPPLPPPMPPPPPEPPKEIDRSAEEMETRKGILARKRQGRQSTILSGSLGDTSEAGAYKKKLLGD